MLFRSVFHPSSRKSCRRSGRRYFCHNGIVPDRYPRKDRRSQTGPLPASVFFCFRPKGRCVSCRTSRKNAYATNPLQPAAQVRGKRRFRMAGSFVPHYEIAPPGTALGEPLRRLRQFRLPRGRMPARRSRHGPATDTDRETHARIERAFRRRHSVTVLFRSVPASDARHTETNRSTIPFLAGISKRINPVHEKTSRSPRPNGTRARRKRASKRQETKKKA